MVECAELQKYDVNFTSPEYEMKCDMSVPPLSSLIDFSDPTKKPWEYYVVPMLSRYVSIVDHQSYLSSLKIN